MAQGVVRKLIVPQLRSAAGVETGGRHGGSISLLATRSCWAEVGFWEAVADCSILSRPSTEYMVTQMALLPKVRAGVLPFPFCFH